ncbi:MAG: hypothetical protein OXI52_10260 [Caldilineaceae bacterium]|nr:hypothetical protein [Caldilineaceae bacterium]
MTRLRFSVLLAAGILSLVFGWILGQRYFTYVLHVGIEPMLYPCPYPDAPATDLSCAYRPHEPAPHIAVRWHGWPAQDGRLTAPQPSGNCLHDILYFDRLPPPQFVYQTTENGD